MESWTGLSATKFAVFVLRLNKERDASCRRTRGGYIRRCDSKVSWNVQHSGAEALPVTNTNKYATESDFELIREQRRKGVNIRAVRRGVLE